MARIIKPIATVAVLAGLVSWACQRDHVDLDRPCHDDGDCVPGAICNAGQCSNTLEPGCVPSTEVCDGVDNDCDGNTDEGFECVLGGSEPCGDGVSIRLCKSDCALSECVSDWLDGAWPVRFAVTINGARVNSDFGDTAVPLRFPAATFDASGGNLTTTDGRDVRITDESGNLLQHQVESWSAARGYVVWVLVPKLHAGESRNLYLYVGNKHAVSASTPEIWDGSYLGVWHMAEEAGAIALADATGAGNDAGGNLGTSPTTLVFGSGQPYNGEEGMAASKVGLAAGSDLTIEGWFLPQGEAQPYRRDLSFNAPVGDVQALWNIPSDLNFASHTFPDYTDLRVVHGTTERTYAVLETDHGFELWVRAPTAGPATYTLVYGQYALDDASSPQNTFHFWANGSSWNAFTAQPTASASGTLVVDSGRLGTTLPFDMRDGYLVQTYATFQQSGTETRESGGLPHITSRMQPPNGLTVATSGVFVKKNPGATGGGLRTSVGQNIGFDQALDLDVPLLNKDIGIGLYQSTVSVFADQQLARQQACAWVSPLDFLLLGAYDGSTAFYRTNYIAMFVRRWPGATPLIAGSRERVGGIGIGDFAIGMQPGFVFASTNASSDFDLVGGSAAQPHHVALVVNSGTAAVYLDGVLAFNLGVGAHGALSTFAIGEPFAVDGSLDEVRLSNVARDPALFALEVASARADFISVGAVETLQ